MTDAERSALIKAGIPAHIHHCPDGEHTWECISPYCGFIIRSCVEHGGQEVRDA